MSHTNQHTEFPNLNGHIYRTYKLLKMFQIRFKHVRLFQIKYLNNFIGYWIITFTFQLISKQENTKSFNYISFFQYWK